MPYFAILDSNTVVNVIIADTLEDANLLAPSSHGTFAIELLNQAGQPGIGWTWDGSTFTKTEPTE